MISTTRRSPNATLVTQSAIDQASEALESLPEKPREQLSLREAVDALRDHITAALEKGYSYEDITEMLSNQGVSIAPSSLKHYLARSNRQIKAKGSDTRTRRKRSTTAVEADEPEDAQLQEQSLPETLSESAPKRGRRPAAKADDSTSRTQSAATSTSTRKRRGGATS